MTSEGEGQGQGERSHAVRYVQIGSTLRRHGFSFVTGLLGLGRVIPRGAKATTGTLRRPAPEAASHLRAVLEELGPTFIKLGQVLSTRSDLLPPVFIAELAKLQDDAPPVPLEEIRAVIRTELGADPEKIFASFEERPLASASIGQAHAATLSDGTRVVVKVRKPGAVSQVNTDLEILRTLAVRATRTWQFARDIDFRGIVDEFAQSLQAELDYLQEGRNAERFSHNFGDDPTIVIPRVFWRHTTSRVLTLERMQGMNVSDTRSLDHAGVDRGLLAQRCSDVVLKMIFEDRFFHADLHPGNLFIQPDGEIALIDFGMVGAIGDELRDQLSRLLIATVRRDAELLTSAVIAISLSRGPVDRMALRDDLKMFLARNRIGSVRQTPFTHLLTDLLGIVRRNRLRLPREMTMLVKALLLIESLAMTLDPDFRLGDALEPYVRRLARERLRMLTLAKRVVTSSVDVGELALELPGTIRRLIDAVDSGGIQVRLRATELEPLLRRAERIGNRLVAGMVGAALITGIGGLVAGERRWRSWENAMVGTGLTTITALSAYLAWTARHRRAG